MKVAEPAAEIKIALVVEYDGSNYHGSQLQANAPTIQGEIEKALRKLTGERTRVTAAGRTDAGVHARGQVFGFRKRKDLPRRAFVDGTNHYLPDDIAVKGAFEVDGSFDPRRSASSREYRYQILVSPTPSPLRKVMAHRVSGGLDAAAMQAACRSLVGRHDFASFVSGAEMQGKSTVRHVFRAEIAEHDDTISFDIEANAFLPHQVRNTVGSLIEVGQGRMTAADFKDILARRSPGLAGPTAPAGGLCLMRVNYPDPWGEIR